MRFDAPGLFGSRRALLAVAMAAGLILSGLPANTASAADEAATDLEKEHLCFNGKGTIEEVLRYCADYIRSKKTDKKHLIVAHGNRAFALAATGDIDGAIEDLNAAAELDPTLPAIYLSRARAYSANKDYDKALADLDKTVELQPTSAAPHVLRASIYEAQEKQDEAIAEYSEGVDKNPKFTPGYVGRGALYRGMKDYDKAQKDFTKVVELEPAKPESYIDRGWVFVLQNELDKADDDFKKALSLQENNAFAIAGLGVVKSRKGKPTDGSADLSMAIKLDPQILDKLRALGVK